MFSDFPDMEVRLMSIVIHLSVCVRKGAVLSQVVFPGQVFK